MTIHLFVHSLPDDRILESNGHFKNGGTEHYQCNNYQFAVIDHLVITFAIDY